MTELALLTGLAAGSACQVEAKTQVPPTRVEAPAPAPQPEPEPPFEWRHDLVAAPEAGTFAVLVANASMRKRPSLDAPAITHRDRAGVVRVIERGEVFTEIELHWPDNPEVHHCFPAPLASIGLRLFVTDDALFDVIREPTTFEFGAGEGLILAPGVVVTHDRVPSHASRLNVVKRLGQDAVRAGGTFVELVTERPLPAVGKTYAPVRADSVRGSLGIPYESLVADEEGVLFVDYGRYRARYFGYVHAQSATDPSHLVVGNACMQVAGHAFRVELDELGTGGTTCGVSLSVREYWVVDAGTELTWASGGVAGRLHDAFSVWSKPRRKGKRRCFTPKMGCYHDEALEVCVPADAITRHEREPYW